LRAALLMPLDKAIEYERDLQTICFATQDAIEGRAVFKEKRPPVFRQRRTGAVRRQSHRVCRRVSGMWPLADDVLRGVKRATPVTQS
jgi:hypothetical protein